MNNEQFRRLLLANSAKPDDAKDQASPPTSKPSNGGALGSRQRSSIPMTPRQVGGIQADFARQLAARQQAAFPKKKFKTSAPKGSKLASGYIDRTTMRDQESSDDREQRLKALEESMKNEEIDRETFERLRSQIAGGDLESTHLVKGLDFKLLERIRQGEDVYSNKAEGAAEAESATDDLVEDEFDRLEEQDVQAITREREKKKGNLSTVALAPGRKRTRDQILADLKASRQAAQKESALGNRFRKIGAKQEPGTRIERDSKGREVLIIVDEDGHEKRKVRKLPPGAEEPKQNDLHMPDKNAKPLGMEVPEQYRKLEQPEEDEDVDIFEGVGDDYNPLAGLDDSGSDSEDDGKANEEHILRKPDADISTDEQAAEEAAKAKPAARNYFKDAKTGLISEETNRTSAMSDPTILAAIKRAAALKAAQTGGDESDEDEDEDEDETKALEERRKKLLQANDRDDYDLDMGFGTSRFEDEEDFEDKKVKLSRWGEDGDGDEGGSRGGASKRKRGPKKRKGDGNNASDVLRVMEQRKRS